MVGVPHSGAKAPEDVRRGGLRDSPAAGVWLLADEAGGGPKLVRCYRISAMLATNPPILPRSPISESQRLLAVGDKALAELAELFDVYPHQITA
jgi:hypothetical protein